MSRAKREIMIIMIDTALWVPPIRFAELKGVSKQVVQNWMARGKVEVWEIKELNVKLIKITAAVVD